LVDRIQSIEARALAGFFAREGDLADDLVDYFSEFDLIVSYLYDPDEIFRQNIARCTSGQFIHGPHRPDERGKVHATRVYLKPLERLAIFEADHVPRLKIDRPAKGDPRETSIKAAPFAESPARGQTIALHPGSGSERKNWPEAKWAGLLEHLIHATSFPLLIVGGVAEGERLQRLAAALPPTRTRVASSLPLVELAVELQRCCGFVGHDSGISHLAAAVGLPGLLLWADTPEEIWRPPNPRMFVLRHPAGLSKLPLDMVIEQLNKLCFQPQP
jgi:heptosyltransferase-3